MLEELGLAQPTAAMRGSVAVASGSNDTESFTAGDARTISGGDRRRGGSTVLDVIRALRDARLRASEAENLLNLVRLRLSGDYLQTSALVRGRPGDFGGQRPERLCRAGIGLPGDRRSGARRSARSATSSDAREVLRSQAIFRRTEARRAVYRGFGRRPFGGTRQRW